MQPRPIRAGATIGAATMSGQLQAGFSNDTSAYGEASRYGAANRSKLEPGGAAPER